MIGMAQSSTFTFQPAAAGDAPVLAALHTATATHLTEVHGRGNWSSKTSEKGALFALRHHDVYVAQLGSELVGTLQLTKKKPWAIDTRYFSPCELPLYLINMAVAPARQRQGIGRRCLEEAKRIARDQPANAIRLDAYDSPAGAGEFYASCGWTKVGRASYRDVPLIYYELVL